MSLEPCVTYRTQAVDLSAIVLAGGRSSRMGQDKALIQIQGVPLICRVCHVASECTSEVYVVTPWVERYRDLLPNHCRLIRETPWDPLGEGVRTHLAGTRSQLLPHGPLIGFAQGLAEVQTDWVLLLACDLPRLQVEALQSWIKELSEVTAAVALLPRQAKGWEPLCGFYRRSCLAALTDFINQGGRSFQHWLAQHPVQELFVSDTCMLFNCNTPEDLDSLAKDS